MGTKRTTLIILTLSLLMLGGCSDELPSEEPTSEAEDIVEPTPSIVQPSPTLDDYSWNQTPTPAPPTTTPPPEPTASVPHITIQHLQMMDISVGFARIEHVDLGQRLMRTEDGGSVWTDITPADAPEADFSVYFYDDSSGWISYRAPAGDLSGEAYTIWRTTDGGTTWQRSAPMDLSDIAAEGVYPGNFFFLSPQVGWFRAVVGPHGAGQAPLTIYRTMDGGLTWQRLADPYSGSNITSFTITGMVFANTSYGWVTRDSNGVEAYAAVQITEDGGATWTSLSLPEPADSPGLFGSGNWCATRHPQLTGRGQGSLVVWCKDYGSGGATYHSYRYTTRDGGETWTIQDIPSGTLFSFTNTLVVASSSARNSDENAIYASQDLGAHWDLVNTVTFYPGDWNFVDSLNGWVMATLEDGRRVLMRTTDGGRTWNELDASFLISPTTGRELQDVQLTSISMMTTSNGWAVGSRTGESERILITTSGGDRWIDVTPRELHPEDSTSMHALAYFLDVNHAWVVFHPGSGHGLETVSIWHTADGGFSWTSHVLPTTTGNTDEYSPLLIYFLDEETGWFLLDVSVYTVLYGTQDGGVTWTSLFNPYSETQLQAAEKTGMAFFDARNGWITVETPDVAEDDYVLMTSDGGQTWTRSLLPGESTLIEIGYNCDSYWPELTSPISGSIIVRCTERYQDPPEEGMFLLETTDAGETWNDVDYPGGQPVRFGPVSIYALGEEMYSSTDAGQTWELVKTVTWQGEFSFINEEEGWAIARADDELALVRTGDGGFNWELIEYEVFEQE